MKIKYGVLLIAGLCAMQFLYAQRGAEKRGDKQFNRFNFYRAAELYKKAATKKKNASQSAKQKLARTYVILDDYANAEVYYGDLAKTPGTDVTNKLNYALSLRANGKYEEADKYFNEYAKANPKDPRAEELKDNSKKIAGLKNNTSYTLSGLNQNSPAIDMGPVYYRDNALVITSNRGTDAYVNRTDVWTGGRFFDMYVLGPDSGTAYGPAKLLKGKKPNSKYHEGPATFSKDFNEMYFTRTNFIKNKLKKSKAKIAHLQLFHATWDAKNNKWMNIELVKNLNSNEYNVGHPSLSPDGKKLFFMSNMPGGFGESDIYVSYKDASGNWVTPINLGKNVNTPGDELFPFISEDGTLYFSSDSRAGFGALDIYSATFNGSEWGNVENLGMPVNSNKDDFGYTSNATGQKGFIVSNRPNGIGLDDIYNFTRNIVVLKGVILEASNKAPIKDAQVKVSSGVDMVATKTSGTDGGFTLTATPGKQYDFTVEKQGYKPATTSVTPTRDFNKKVEIYLAPVETKETVTLNVNVLDTYDGANLQGAVIKVTDRNTGEEFTCTTDASGKCNVELKSNTSYEVCAVKDGDAESGYELLCRDVNTNGMAPGNSKDETFELRLITKGTVFVMDNIYYDLNKSNIRPDAAKELNKIVKLLKQYPNMDMEVSSHTDSRASDQYNLNLSAQRALSVVKYLESKGIKSSRLIAVGFGERKLINNCTDGADCTEEQHQKNRRTEFKVLKVK
jgi:outer membrane protein OmpA-like peptidoglycan-associated protein/tetratricopeptide (TPR) repeat protein